MVSSERWCPCAAGGTGTNCPVGGAGTNVVHAMTDTGFTKGLSRSSRPGVEDLDWFEVYHPAPPMTLDLAGLAAELTSDNEGAGHQRPASRGGRGQPGD